MNGSDRVSPQWIGPYRVLNALGEGGMGRVYLCEQLQPIRRRVAVKVLHRGLNSAGMRERFRSEPQWLALMDHSGIARVFDAGEQQGQPYFVMEYVPGVPITDYCRERKLRVRERVSLLIAICAAVQHAHQKGVMHLDLKPSNVLVVDTDGRPQPKIIDFGIARSVHGAPATTNFVASPAYMSPEQAELDASGVDTRADIYTLGALLYELLTGRTPLLADDRPLPLTELRSLLRTRRPPPPTRLLMQVGNAAHAAEFGHGSPHALRRELRNELDWIVLKALAAEPAGRYATAAELAADLRRYLDHRPVSAARPGRWYGLRKLCQRHRLGSAVLLLLGITLIVFSTWSGRQAYRLSVERDRARMEALKARESTEFMVEMFALGNPIAGYGRDLTVRQALDIGLQRMSAGYPAHPEVRAEMLYNIARVHVGIGLPERAEPLLAHVLADTATDSRLHQAARELLARARRTADVSRRPSAESS